MELSVHPYFLKFQRPFELAHGTREGTQLAFVMLHHEGITAYGEASLPPYLKESYDSVHEWVMKQSDSLADILKKNPFEDSSSIPFSADHPAASAALSSAILHWYVASQGKTLADYVPSSGSRPELCLTLSKRDYDHLEEKLKLAQRFSVLKLKLTGTYDDMEFVEAVRKRTEMPFAVDVNQGCKNKEEAARLIHALEAKQCLMVEQPLKDIDHDGHYWLKQRVQTPVIADESIRLFDDLLQYHEAYSGVNVKLMKCGGLLQAQKMLQYEVSANEGRDFIKVLGCMSESSLGVY
ncbi:MAG: hypothetical protein HKO93_03175, partial [Flavobacteriales bacterium]|nr:hypothetical protein [Flavobacteriales bacterium]